MTDPAERGGPQRIQRKRTKGWRMPAGAIYVGRPGPFGNPFDWMLYGREAAVEFYARWLQDDLTTAEKASLGFDFWPTEAAEKASILHRLDILAGKDLLCWCPLDQPCHADVLLEIANDPAAHGKG